MEPNEKELQEQEVVVEETAQPEVVDEQPSEAPSEEPTEAPQEEEKQEEIVEELSKEEDSSDTDSANAGTASLENPSEENETEEKSEGGEKSDDTPSEQPSEEPSDAPEEEKVEDGADENKEEAPRVDEELEKARREIEEYKHQEEKRVAVQNIQVEAQKAAQTYDDFTDKLAKALEDTFKQYGIDTEQSLDELRASDPAKFAIAQELIGHAEHIRDAKIQELQAPVIQAQKDLVFKEASRMMCAYDLTDEQAQETANTLVNIINNVGVNDVDEDLKAKVELAVARAKMIKPDTLRVEKEEQKVEEPKVGEVQVKEQNENMATEAAEEPKEEAQEPPTEAPTEAPKADLNAFKEGATSGDIVVDNGGGITVDNVLQELAKLPSRQRPAFYKEHEALINQAAIKRYRKQGLR